MMLRFFVPSILLILCSSSIAQIPSPLNTRGIEYPTFRYLQWRYLESTSVEDATSLGYTQETWDRPGTDIMELISFEGLGLAQSVVENIGFTEDVWDCYINHYYFFEWSDLSPEIQGYMTVIGWDESTWGGEKPSSYVMFWDELTDEQRGNATEVCYFEATWNRDTLQYWTTGRPTVSPTPAPSIISAIPTVAPTPEKSGSPPAALSQILALLLATSTVLILAV